MILAILQKLFNFISIFFLIFILSSVTFAIDGSSIYIKPYAIFNNNISNSTIEIDLEGLDVQIITIQINVYSDPTPDNFGFTAYGYNDSTNQFQLFDDGTHGDKIANDHVYTIGGIKTDISELPERGFLRLWCKVNIDGEATNIYVPSFFVVEEEPFLYVEHNDYVLSNYVVNYYATSISSPQEITRNFYNTFNDDYNFIFYLFEYGNYSASNYNAVKNDVSGIGSSLFDNTASWGSAGKLEGVIRYENTDRQMILVPNSTDFHEIGHRWLAYLDDVKLDLSYDGAHWKNNTTIVGMMNACCYPFVYNGNGTFSHFCNFRFNEYSPLELYLMGAISAQELDTSMDLYILEDPSIYDRLNSHIPCDSTVEPENYIKISSNDIISVYGERSPNWLSSTKNLIIAVIMITKEKMTREEVNVVNKVLRHYSGPYNPDELEGLDWYNVPSFSNYTKNKLSLDFEITSNQGKTDSDGDGLTDDLEKVICTLVDDADTDDDGIMDGVEDINNNGIKDTGETNPCKADTDGDGLQDGTELGYTTGHSTDTDLIYFQPDQDYTTTTNPLNSDSDGDGISDGDEDANLNGKVDDGESDPNDMYNPNSFPWEIFYPAFIKKK